MNKGYSKKQEETFDDLIDQLQELIVFVETAKKEMGKHLFEECSTETVIDVLTTLDSELEIYNKEVTGG